MFRPRVIPSLLLSGTGLVKTKNFRKPVYLGDAINIIRILNDKEVDEILLLDILASRENRSPNFRLLYDLATECFVPVGYGGGIRTADDAVRILASGIEKVVLNSSIVEKPNLITEIATRVGSQSVVASIDVRKNFWKRHRVHSWTGARPVTPDPIVLARIFEDAGAGEILLTSVDHEGTMSGYDLNLVQLVSQAVRIPVVASGGAGSLADFTSAVAAGAAAVAAGSLFVFHGPHRAVLINYPSDAELKHTFAKYTHNRKSHMQ